MKLTYFISHTIFIIILSLITFTPLEASERFLFKKDGSFFLKHLKGRKELIEENRKLTEERDSLQCLVNKYATKISDQDSMRSKIIKIFDENDEDNLGAGLNPEDYNAEVTDSLLKVLWHLHKKTSSSDEGEGYDMDSVHFSSNVPDEVFIERLKNMNSFITLPYNETVRNYIILYTEKMPGKMSHMLGLAKYYLPIFEETFNKYDMPEELKYMAVIESALNPLAVSRAGAKGMWQFMYNTAKIYGLKINSFVDERLDPFKAADAAARYLKDAYAVFGDWNLAISSYNCGSGNVLKAIRRSGKMDFWSIYNYLPKETRGYVPAFVGAMYAFKYYKEHGIIPDTLNLPSNIDTLEIKKNLHFKQLTEVTSIPSDILKQLNPQYIHDIIPGNDEKYILRIPYKYTSSFIENEDTIYAYKADELFNPTEIQKIKNNSEQTYGKTWYKVKKGDCLGSIASRNRISVSKLRKWNKLRGNNIRVGQRLVIYK